MSTNSPSPDRPFAGKVAFVTGGTRGIGLAVASELASRGADIAINYFRNHEAARVAEEAITGLGARCLVERAHLAEEDAIDGFFGKIEAEFGRLDILVTNAASGVMRKPTELTTRHWDWTMDINARAPWLCAMRAAELMGDGGKIINISSPGSGRVLDDYFAVGVSKAALEAVTRYLAVDLASRNIAVNAVSAGFIMTDALDAFAEADGVKKLASRPTPAGRNVRQEDVAKVVAWLCTDDAEMIRGQVILVDGGETVLFR